VNDRNSPPTIADVARRAGVSTATVSRVLAGVGRARPDTANAVTSAAKDLGYRPSGVARSLRVNRTQTLGLIVTDIENPFFPELVQTANVAARALGYSILLGTAAYEEQQALHYIELMIDRRVDGIVLASSQVSEAALPWLLRSPVPVIVVNAEPVDGGVPVITSDNVGGSRMAVEHLVSLGHRRIAYIRGPQNYTAAIPRLEGFRAGCSAAGLAAENTPVFQGKGLVESGERAAEQLLREAPDITAVVCYNDLTAIGVLRGLRSAGRLVPDEISVIGFDDIAAASWVAPTLTTVAQQKGEMGRQAVQHLVAVIAGRSDGGPGNVVRLATTLRRRESTGPVPVTEQEGRR
jgi:LacI family transcriptional regulator